MLQLGRRFTSSSTPTSTPRECSQRSGRPSGRVLSWQTRLPIRVLAARGQHARAICSRHQAVATTQQARWTVEDAAEKLPADLVNWPPGQRPEKGKITASALSRLKREHLLAELSRLGLPIPESANKPRLQALLLDALTTLHRSRASSARGAGGNSSRVVGTTCEPPGASLHEALADGPSSTADSLPAPTVSEASSGRMAARRQAMSYQHTGGPSAGSAAPQRPTEEGSGPLAAQRSNHSGSHLTSHAPTQQQQQQQHQRPRQQRPMPHAQDPPGRIFPDALSAERVVVLCPVEDGWRQVSGNQMDATAVHSNSTGLQLCFLRTSSAPASRPARCTAIRMDHSVWLMDCGEDAQRALPLRPELKSGRIERICITSSSDATLFGLPGMLCTIAAAREKGHELADIPVHVYGPPGIAKYIKTMLGLSDTYLLVPVIIHELVRHAVKSDEPVVVDNRSRLFKVEIAPDQLNPDGFYDGDLVAFMRRHERKRKRAPTDPRASTKPIPLPGPGDPQRQNVPEAELRWTIACGASHSLTAVVQGSDGGFAFVIQEADRNGRLDVGKCEALKVPSRLRGSIKAGTPWVNEDGMQVTAAMLCGLDIPGRKLTFAGGEAATCLSQGLLDAVAGTDLLIADIPPAEGEMHSEGITALPARLEGLVADKTLGHLVVAGGAIPSQSERQPAAETARAHDRMLQEAGDNRHITMALELMLIVIEKKS